MPNPEFFRPAFTALATDGCIGDPNGMTAYAYLRVSGDDQADEGRSGLPRQIAHVHEIAAKKGYRIPWELVYADDYTGFDFQTRPQLTILRRELHSLTRRAQVVVIEHLDRLSRNADWHQGFLLDEMKQMGVMPVFWKEFSSRVERAVMGAISQEGMEQEKRRMMEGKLYKARSGRVTATVAAYGYRFVDASGQESANARKDTYYAVREDEAEIIRLIFRRVAAGDPMRGIALELEMAGVRPPKQYRHWEATQLRLFIRNEIYRGDFYAHRWEHTTVHKPGKDGFSTRSVKCKVERPREEWIHVPVPPIVSRELWEAANHMITQNARTSRRNAKEPYLLTGLVRCAYCGWIYAGTTRPQRKRGREYKPYRGYRCPHYSTRPKYLSEHHECRNSHIPCDRLDNAVWHVVCEALLNPALLLAALDEDATSEGNRQLEQQIDFLAREMDSRRDDDEKLLRAYMAGAFDEHEYTARRRMVKEENRRLMEEHARLCGQVLSRDQLAQRKATVTAFSERLRREHIPVDPPFGLKQRIIKLVVDEITLDVPKGWLKLDGAIRGEFAIENTLADTGSSPSPAGSSPGTSACRAPD